MTPTEVPLDLYHLGRKWSLHHARVNGVGYALIYI